MELNGESAEPVQGITLWTFTETSITPSSTARDRATLTGQSTRSSSCNGKQGNPTPRLWGVLNTLPQVTETR
eukprot:2303840-Amphidinium_carterae.1